MIKTYRTKLIAKEKLARDVYQFRFRCLSPREIDFIPGQYLILKVPIDGGTVSRLYSIGSPRSEKNQFTLIVKLVNNGAASRYFDRLSLGETVTFQGPAGLFGWKNRFPDKVLIATGTGIVPFRSMMSSLNKEEKRRFSISLFWGLADFEDIFLKEELIKMAAERANFHYQICLSRAPKNSSPTAEGLSIHRGRLTEPLVDYLRKNRLAEREFYLCGRRETVEAIKNLLISEGIKQEQIFFEKF